MDIISQKVICPKCHSTDVYKFGKDPKTGHQKYQCKTCKHQATFLNPVNKGERKWSARGSKKGYPSCPACKHATYIHHDYKYYTNFTCRHCYHSFFIIKPNCIDDVSSSTLFR